MNYILDNSTLIVVKNSKDAANALRIFLNTSSLAFVPPYTFTVACILWNVLKPDSKNKLMLAMKSKLGGYYTKLEIVTYAMATEPIDPMPFLLAHEPLFLKLLSLLGLDGISVEGFLNSIDQYIDRIIQLLDNYSGLVEKMLNTVNEGIASVKQQAMGVLTKQGGKRTKRNRKRSKRRRNISRNQK
jgi:hypothetical protein